MKTLTALSVAILLALATPQVTQARPHGNAPDASQPVGSTRQDSRQQARVAEMLSRFDLNQDGQIAQDEVQSIHTDEFTRLDADTDGFISFAEFQQAAPPDGPGMHGGGRGHRPPPHGCASDTTGTTTTCQPPADRAQHQQAHFTRLDADGDGKISKAEFMTNLPLFDRFDCDENGVITQAELLSKPCQVTQTQ